MTIFDLLFILVLLTSFVILLTAAVSAIHGRGATAIRFLRVFAICFAVYMIVVFVVALATPRRIINLGEERCFDDWCISVDHAEHTGNAYLVTFRLSSQARRVSQREKGLHVYLTDERGRRFDPVPAPSAIPFDVLLGPGDSMETSRSFPLPGDARAVGVVMAHEGCFPGCFIIGDEESPLHKRTIVPLP